MASTRIDNTSIKDVVEGDILFKNMFEQWAELEKLLRKLEVNKATGGGTAEDEAVLNYMKIKLKNLERENRQLKIKIQQIKNIIGRF